MSRSSGRLIGITGHQTLSTETRELVSHAVKKELLRVSDFVVFTSLAAGADQICAQAAIDIGGQLIVVLPAERYEKSFASNIDAENYEQLLSHATDVIRMPFEEPSEAAYWAAGQEIVDRTSLLLAVWDGKPAGGLGGTADVVNYARSRDKDVIIIWPKGASRV